MNAQPCIRGMRLTVRRVVEAVALDPNRDDLFRNYLELEPDDVGQALAFVAANLEDSGSESTAACPPARRGPMAHQCGCFGVKREGTSVEKSSKAICGRSRISRTGWPERKIPTAIFVVRFLIDKRVSCNRHLSKTN